MIERLYTAKKVHKCSGGCGRDILPGEGYMQVSEPPWQNYEADVDDEGRMVGYLVDEKDRRWYVVNYHYPECTYQYY